MSEPVGVLGGIFDPVHFGHLSAGRMACEHFHLDRLIFVPAGVPPHKVSTVTASPAERLEMLRIALRGEPDALIWEEEVHRTGVSYTIDTLRELSLAFPGAPIHFIVGADNLPEIHTWHRYREILAMVTLCITSRPGYSTVIPPDLSDADIRDFPSPELGISSSLLRGYFARGYSCRFLLPEGVREYISKKGLYRMCTDPSDTCV